MSADVDPDLTRDDEEIARCLSLSESDFAEMQRRQVDADESFARSLASEDAASLALADLIARAIAAKDLIAQAFVPRVNDAAIVASPPTASEREEDHGRLALRLDFYGLREKACAGDGNCQFRALSDQLFRDVRYHEEVRAQVIERLLANREAYEAYVAPLEFHEYVEKMSALGTWGDHVTLQACADAYSVVINVLTSYSDNGFIEIVPSDGSAADAPRSLWLSFFAEVHYNSIYPENVDV